MEEDGNVRTIMLVSDSVSLMMYFGRNLEIDPFLSLRNILTTIFSETVLRQRESSLMPILKDILKYQYAPLKHVAVVVMHRMYHDCEGKDPLIIPPFPL